MTVKPTGRLPPFQPHWMSGRTAEELKVVTALVCGDDVIIEGGGGAGKNRIVGHYLAERSRTPIQIDVVGRPVDLFRPARLVEVADIAGLPHADSIPAILWIDEANRYDLRPVIPALPNYDQVILTWSYGQGHLISAAFEEAMRPRSSQHFRLQQNIRASRPPTGSLPSFLGEAPAYEPTFSSLERRPFNITQAPADEISTALAISVIAVRYALSKRPILVVAERERTISILRELGRQMPFPRLRVITAAQLQGHDESIVIYPSAEAEPDTRAPIDVHSLEVLATRARRKFHLIVQGPTAAAYVPDDVFHMPLSPDYQRFFTHVMAQRFVLEPRRQSIMLYDDVTLTTAILLVLYSPEDPPESAHEARRLLIAALSRKIPAAALDIRQLHDDVFDPKNPQLAAALQNAVRQKPGRRHGEMVLYPPIIEDLRLRPAQRASRAR